MSYGHTKNPSCCYQCDKRVMGCHASCENFKKEKEERIAEDKKKKEFLYPSGSRYFKNPNKITCLCARQSKRRYR